MDPVAKPSEQSPAAADVEWDEDLYQATCPLLAEPEIEPTSRLTGIAILLFTLILFALSFASDGDFQGLAVLISVLFLHELGHYLGMMAFGYRNLRMFFIPFFGAAVMGVKHAVPVWQQVVVLLLGPLPGILLGTALQWYFQSSRDNMLGMLIIWLLVLNGFNLLPIIPLDGGRILDVLLFARRPMLSVAFRVVAIVALVALAYRMELNCVTPFLILIALVLLFGLPSSYRKARLQRAFRDNPLNLPDRVEDLSDWQRRELFGWSLLFNPLDSTPSSHAANIRQLHENMVAKPPSLFVWLVLLLTYLGAIGTCFGGVMLHLHHSEQAQFQRKTRELLDEIEKKNAPAQRSRQSPPRQHLSEIALTDASDRFSLNLASSPHPGGPLCELPRNQSGRRPT